MDICTGLFLGTSRGKNNAEFLSWGPSTELSVSGLCPRDEEESASSWNKNVNVQAREDQAMLGKNEDLLYIIIYICLVNFFWTIDKGGNQLDY